MEEGRKKGRSREGRGSEEWDLVGCWNRTQRMNVVRQWVRKE